MVHLAKAVLSSNEELRAQNEVIFKVNLMWPLLKGLFNQLLCDTFKKQSYHKIV